MNFRSGRQWNRFRGGGLNGQGRCGAVNDGFRGGEVWYGNCCGQGRG